jgi:hypothetical protein
LLEQKFKGLGTVIKNKVPNLNEVKVRETLVWLAGILSTDGSIAKRKNGKGLLINVTSVELDWGHSSQTTTFRSRN